MRSDNLLHSPSLVGYSLTKPFVKATIFFDRKISLSTEKLPINLWKVAKVVALLLLTVPASIGIVLKLADFYLRRKVTTIAVSENVKSGLARNLNAIFVNKSVSSDKIYDSYRQGLDFADGEGNSPRDNDRELNIGSVALEELLQSQFRNKEEEVKLEKEKFEALSALIQCGAKVSGKILWLAARHADSEVFKFLLSNATTDRLNFNDYSNLLEQACESNNIDKVIAIFNKNNSLVVRRGYVDEHREVSNDIKNYLNRVGAVTAN